MNDGPTAGGEVDVVALMAEIGEEVRRKQEAGLYPPEIQVELDLSEHGRTGGDRRELPLGRALSNLQQSSRFTALVTTASKKPVIGPVVARAKEGLRSSLLWYMNGILQQVSRFANATVSTASLLAERTAGLEDRLAAIEKRLDELAAREQEQEQEQERP